MRRYIGSLVLALVLGACSPRVQPALVAEPASPLPPTTFSTSQLTVAPTASPAVATPTAHRLDAKPTVEPQAPTAARGEATWHGVRFQYDPQRFRFVETVRGDSQAHAAADLVETPNPCQDSIGTDCTPGDVALRLYSRDGRDFWTWLAQQQMVFSGSSQGDFVDLVLAGQPAVAWSGDGIFFGARNTYAVPIGEDVLIVGGVGLEWFVNGLQLEHPPARTLAPGQIAMTTPGRTWDLWSEPERGTRVIERPQLYGGAFVTILATEAQAVQVQTSEGVTGWIHAPAADALSSQLALLGEQARFTPYSGARIADGHTIPLRESPRSTAPTRDQLTRSEQAFAVIGVRGDWLRVLVPNIGEGWARWYYDGAQYIEPVGSANSSAVSP